MWVLNIVWLCLHQIQAQCNLFIKYFNKMLNIKIFLGLIKFSKLIFVWNFHKYYHAFILKIKLLLNSVIFINICSWKSHFCGLFHIFVSEMYFEIKCVHVPVFFYRKSSKRFFLILLGLKRGIIRNWVSVTNSNVLTTTVLSDGVQLWYFKLMIIWSNRIHSLKELISTTLGGKKF